MVNRRHSQLGIEIGWAQNRPNFGVDSSAAAHLRRVYGGNTQPDVTNIPVGREIFCKRE